MGQVLPFLKTLKNSYFFPIQQKAVRGDPDFVGVSCGIFVGLELKAPKGRLAPIQKWKGSEIQRAGGLYLVADPQNWEEIKRLLTQIDQGEKIT